MILREKFTVTQIEPPPIAIVEPLEVSYEPATTVRLERLNDELELTVEVRVDPSVLELVEETGRYRRGHDGVEEMVSALQVRGLGDNTSMIGREFLSFVTFLTDVPLRMSARLDGKVIVPESSSERSVIDSYGTSEGYQGTQVRLAIRTFNPALTSENVAALTSKAPGARLYADAMTIDHPVARFRELWRVLESAFQLRDDPLVDRLAQYRPALGMDFTREELDRLLVLRGRASHAQSRSGIAEIVKVDQDCARHIPRLKCLVERVVLTKASWGYPTVADQPSAALRGFIDSEGNPVYLSG